MSAAKNKATADLEPIFALCRKYGVAQLKGDFGEVTFGPPAQHLPLPARATDLDVEEDEEEARYQRELSEWAKSKGVLADDDKGIDG